MNCDTMDRFLKCYDRISVGWVVFRILLGGYVRNAERKGKGREGKEREGKERKGLGQIAPLLVQIESPK